MMALKRIGKRIGIMKILMMAAALLLVVVMWRCTGDFDANGTRMERELR